MTFKFNKSLEDAIRRGDPEIADEIERRLEAWFEKPTVDSLWTPTGGGSDPRRVMGFDIGGRITDDSTAFAAHTSWTPTWSSAGTDPTIGNGSIIGRYWRLGNLVIGRIAITYGSTSTAGTGLYKISLPEAAVSSGQCIGTGQIHVQSGGNRHPLSFENDTTTTMFGVDMASPATGWATGAPITWATGDKIELNFMYQAAT